MPNIGWQELVLVLVVVLIIFGPKRLPELGRSLGRGIREFRKATSELHETVDAGGETPSAPSQQAVGPAQGPAEIPAGADQPAVVSSAQSGETAASGSAPVAGEQGRDR